MQVDQKENGVWSGGGVLELRSGEGVVPSPLKFFLNFQVNTEGFILHFYCKKLVARNRTRD